MEKHGGNGTSTFPITRRIGRPNALSHAEGPDQGVDGPWVSQEQGVLDDEGVDWFSRGRGRARPRSRWCEGATTVARQTMSRASEISSVRR